MPPPPSVQSAGNSGSAGRANSLGSGPNVVPPAPTVRSATHDAGNARLNSMAGASQVVPPPPAVSGGNSAGVGRQSSSLGAGPSVVHPPPSIEGASNANRDARRGSTATPGAQVVPPPPSVAGTEKRAGLGGRERCRAPGQMWSALRLRCRVRATSTETPASVRCAVQVLRRCPRLRRYRSGGPGGRRFEDRSLSGSGSEVVAPAPSVENASNVGATGRLGALSGGGRQPAHRLRRSRVPRIGCRRLSPWILCRRSHQPMASVANAEGKATIEELPLGLLGLVFATPGSSYFSNFEVSSPETLLARICSSSSWFTNSSLSKAAV